MSFKQIATAITRNAYKAKFIFDKHKPEILVIGGVIGGVATVVTACRATTKASRIIQEAKEKLNDIREVTENEEFTDRYDEEDAKKDIVVVYTQTGLKLVKTYAPSVLLGVVSFGSILFGHKILRGRNIALAAAYATVDESFKKYRKNVVDKFGEKVDKQLKYNLIDKEIEDVEIDEDGNEKKVKKTVSVSTDLKASPYSMIFDCPQRGWDPNVSITLAYLRAQERYANDLLVVRKNVYLNDILKMLDFPETLEGQVIGWTYDPTDPSRQNNISFGIDNVYTADERTGILLTFNPDGNIWLEQAEKLKKRGSK